ncbi:MAG: sel1 repeat family protein, partial [Burkholderiales bacterium]|nr:sel1 repeat family protein [Burkholderiales bacterium]
EGAEQDFATAQAWFAKAASHPELNASTSEDIFANGAAAHFCYAELLYLRLREAQNSEPDEVALMEQWLLFAANKNCAEAQYRLGNCYAKGELLAQDLAKARHWLQLAAGQHYSARNLLKELA